MALKDSIPKSWLPEHWEEIDRGGNEQQVIIRFGHFNPEDKADPLLVSGQPTAEINGEAVSVHGVSTRGSMKVFFESMTKMSASGFMQGYTPAKIQEIRAQFNKAQSEKYDMTSDISIIRYDSAAMAKEALEQQLALHNPQTSGTVMMGMLTKLPPEVLKTLSKEQLKMMETMKEKLAAVPKVPASQVPASYLQGKYLGYPVVYMEVDNPAYEQWIKPKPKVKVDPKKFQGGGFDPMAKQLPHRPPPVAPPAKIRSYFAMQIGSYLLSGSLLNQAAILPSGKSYCESLTKHRIYVETEKVEGQTYTTKHLLPVASDIGQEGYANQEEMEGMLKKVIGYLEK
jgi:hypothetical protein